MGFTARETYAHTVPEFWEVFSGWQAANVPQDTAPEPMTRADLKRLIRDHGHKLNGQ